MAKSLSIQIPDATREVIEKLKKRFGVSTDEEVLSRALGLANTAVQVAGDKHIVTLSGGTSDASVTISLDE